MFHLEEQTQTRIAIYIVAAALEARIEADTPDADRAVALLRDLARIANGY